MTRALFVLCFFIATVVLLASIKTAPAASPSIPAKYHGMWCHLEGRPYLIDCSNGPVKISARLYTKGDEVCKPVHIAVDKHNFYLGAHKIKFICEWADFGDKVTPHSGSEEHSFATWSRPGSGTKRLYIDDGDGTASEGD